MRRFFTTSERLSCSHAIPLLPMHYTFGRASKQVVLGSHISLGNPRDSYLAVLFSNQCVPLTTDLIFRLVCVYHTNNHYLSYMKTGTPD